MKSPAHYQERFSLSYEPSAYQAALWAECEKTGDDRKPFVVKAAAGAGKTTSLVWAASLVIDPRRAYEDVLAVVFASANAEDMSGKFQDENINGVRVSTIHSHGNGALFKAFGAAKRLDEDGDKYRTMVDEARAELATGKLYGRKVPAKLVELLEAEPSSWPRREILQLVKFARLDLVDFRLPIGDLTTVIEDMIEKHAMMIEPEYDSVVPSIVKHCMVESFNAADRILARHELVHACSGVRSRSERGIRSYVRAVVRNSGEDWNSRHESVVLDIAKVGPKAAADIARGEKSEYQLEYDFVDMIWLPVVLDLTPRLYSTILLDECQDASAVARVLLDRSLRRRGHAGSRLIFIGDPMQAIYGFAGADTESFDRIVDYCEGRVMPLSVCYRCGSSIIDYVKATCYPEGTPESEMIQAAPGAIAGKVEPRCKESRFIAEVKAGDMVLARRTAPLVTTLFQLVADGRSATIKGRDFAGLMVSTARAVAERGEKRNLSFLDALDSWQNEKFDAVYRAAKDRDDAAEKVGVIEDRAECVRVIWGRVASQSKPTLALFESECAAIFSDKLSPIVLSTAHRAKGLEADNVWVIEPERLENPDYRSIEQAKQEMHLRYVVFTRARKLLALVRADGRTDAKEGEVRDDEID